MIAAITLRCRLLLIWFLCVVGSLFALCSMLYYVFRNPSKAWVRAISADQNVNASLNGNPDETISSRAHRAQAKNRWACRLCKLLDIFDTNHCEKSSGV